MKYMRELCFELWLELDFEKEPVEREGGGGGECLPALTKEYGKEDNWKVKGLNLIRMRLSAVVLVVTCACVCVCVFGDDRFKGGKKKKKKHRKEEYNVWLGWNDLSSYVDVFGFWIQFIQFLPLTIVYHVPDKNGIIYGNRNNFF